MCEIDLEYAEVWEMRPRVARQAHSCDMCGGPITKGEPYISHFSVHQREPQSDMMCQACCEAYDDFYAEHGQCGTPSYMPTLLDECVSGLLYHPETARWRLAIVQMDARNAAAKAVANG